MCLIFLSLHQHPNYKLIVAANRDEFYARKTLPAQFWEDHPEIVGGRDIEARKPNGTYGTWMAMNKNGRIAMVTNFRDLKNLKSVAPSRGHLVTDFLLTAENPFSYLKAIEKDKHLYNGFNLIVGNMEELFYLSNYKDGIEKMENGFHGLSNALLNTPWPKVKEGKEKMSHLFDADKIESGKLLNGLYDDRQAPDNQLPDTGVGLERERMLSSMFIKSPNYGSRCSTVITVDLNNQVEFTERVYDLNTFQFDEQTFKFAIE
ncbi:MAG TPA: hypothetical protein DGG95_11220 [Cytophagales bacterium]|jgi:uncharacterized protein with NRDE domain|nr:hypothetical protein [Cytophagales bacterium]